MSSKDPVVDELRGLALFEGFSDSELERVAQLAERVEAETGAVLIEQGRVGQEVFVVLDGDASIFVGDEHIATVGRGVVLGEMSLFDHRPRSATVVAVSPMKLLRLNSKNAKRLLEEMPIAHDRIMEILASRLKANSSDA